MDIDSLLHFIGAIQSRSIKMIGVIREKKNFALGKLDGYSFRRLVVGENFLLYNVHVDMKYWLCAGRRTLCPPVAMPGSAQLCSGPLTSQVTPTWPDTTNTQLPDKMDGKMIKYKMFLAMKYFILSHLKYLLIKDNLQRWLS